MWALDNEVPHFPSIVMVAFLAHPSLVIRDADLVNDILSLHERTRTSRLALGTISMFFQCRRGFLLFQRLTVCILASWLLNRLLLLPQLPLLIKRITTRRIAKSARKRPI